MPTEAEHKSASERHLIAYRDTVEQHPDWAAVMLFYCAVQACEMLFARDGHHSVDHGQRDFRLKSQYASLWPHYRRLKSESLKTRYLRRVPDDG